MMRQLTVADFARRMVFSTGPSGSGKSLVEEALRNHCKDSGLKFQYESSGNLFRQLPADPAIKKTMQGGAFIETLDKIMPSLVDIFEDHVRSITKGEETILNLDGFLRKGDYFTSDGAFIPSQVKQVAEAFTRALRNIACEDEVLKKTLDSRLLSQVLNHKDVSCLDLKAESEDIASKFASNIQHCIIRIPPGDAEALMRLRSTKALRDIKKEITGKDNGKVDSVLVFLDEAIQIQSGKKFGKESSFTHFNFTDGDRGDTFMEGLIASFYEYQKIESPEKPSLKSAIKASTEKFGIILSKNTELPRSDDDMSSSRISRLLEYRDKTIPMLMGDEVRILERDKDEGVAILENGPSLGIDYKTLLTSAESVAQEIVSGKKPSLEIEWPTSLRERA